MCGCIFLQRKTSFFYDYIIIDTVLNRNNVTYLGIIYQKDFILNLHINDIVNKAFKTLGFLKQITSDFKTHCILIKLFNICVRPFLEYGYNVWN